MRDRLAEIAFSVAGCRYDWTDVLLWARGWGGWAAFETSVRLGLACARRAAEDADAEGPDADLVQAAANEFRYDRSLLSAEETKAWLRRSGLTVEAWMACVERAALKRWWAGDAAAILAAHPPTDADVDAVLWCEGVCSGELARWAQALAGRAAVHARLNDERSEGDADAGVAEVLARVPGDLTRGLRGTRGPRGADRLRRLARLELALQQFAGQILTAEAIQEHIAARRLEWIALECEILQLPDEHTAREAALLFRADGLGLSEVARLAHAAVHRARVYLEDAEPALRERLLSAARGDLVGPVRAGDAFQLVLVRDKVMPAAADAAVRRRAEADLLARRLAREVEARVQWHHPVCREAP
jgi:hypothetical protein